MSSANRRTRLRPRRLAEYSDAVGPVDELVRGAPRIDQDAADRHGDLEQAIAVAHRSARDAPPQGVGDLVQLRVPLEGGREDDELLAAPARDGVERAKRRVGAALPTSTSTASPVRCPKVSFTSLKRSTSTSNSPGVSRSLRERASSRVEHLGEVAAIEDAGQRVGTRGLSRQPLGPHLGRGVADDPLDDQPIADRAVGIPPPRIHRVTPSRPIMRQWTSLISPRR